MSARNHLLSYLKSGAGLIIGQHAGGGNWHPTGRAATIAPLPKKPGLVGFDLGYGGWGLRPDNHAKPDGERHAAAEEP